MSREVRIRITKDGKVEIDSTVYDDCQEVAKTLTKHLGEVESFVEKDETAPEELTIEIDTD